LPNLGQGTQPNIFPTLLGLVFVLPNLQFSLPIQDLFLKR
jgi:hypothetical protein